MKRFKVYDLKPCNCICKIARSCELVNKFLRLMIFLLFSVLFINHKSLIINHVYAAESTPSSEIRSKLEELKKEIASKAAKLKETVDRKLKNKAYIGEIKSKSDTTLTLAAQSGPKIVNINQDTVFRSNIKSRQKNLQNSVSIDDYVAALGDSDETGVLTAKKIILLPAPGYKPKTYLWGQIISISDQLATLKNSEFKNIAISLPSDSKTKINDFVIMTGSKDKNNVFDAEFVYVIPQGGIIRLKKLATPSAKSATQSSKITPASR